MKTLKLVLLTALLTIGLASLRSGDSANKTDTTNTTHKPQQLPELQRRNGLQSATPNPVVGVTSSDNYVRFAPDQDTSGSIKTIRFGVGQGIQLHQANLGRV
ncbi:MAG: hypothetical protein IPI14_08580 [Polaromonas sp.]|nr:hypothetical protein [Polaromonas sp.]